MNRQLLGVVLLAGVLMASGCVPQEEEADQGPGPDNGCGFVGEEGGCDDPAPQPDAVLPDPEPEVVEPTCTYPEGAPLRPTFGQTMPALTWNTAYLGDGSATKLSLEEVFCNEEDFGHIDTILFVVGAGWCPACPQYAAYVDSVYDTLESEGVMLIWYEAEDRQYNPSSSQESNATITRYLGPDSIGYRVGDDDTLPNANVIRNNRLVQAFPTQFMVRKTDMKIIAASTNSELLLPIVQIARHPEANWDDASNNIIEWEAGTTCETDVDCDTGTLIPYCFPHRDQNNQLTGWNHGYCSGLDCADDAACGEGGICAPVDSSGLTACFKGCDTEDQCRPGYACGPLSGALGPKACIPN